MALTRLLTVLTIMGHGDVAKTIKKKLKKETLKTNGFGKKKYIPPSDTKPLSEQFNSFLWISVFPDDLTQEHMSNIYEELLLFEKAQKDQET